MASVKSGRPLAVGDQKLGCLSNGMLVIAEEDFLPCE